MKSGGPSPSSEKGGGKNRQRGTSGVKLGRNKLLRLEIR